MSENTTPFTPTNRIVSKQLWQAHLVMKLPGQSRKDEGLSDDVTTRHEMAHDSAIVTKRLFVKALKPLKTAYTRTRNAFREMTHEFLGGVHCVVDAEREQLAQTMASYHAIYITLRDAFIADYPSILEVERLEKGDAFKESDYPSAAALAEKFGFEFAAMPLPLPNQFVRGVLTAEIEEKMAAEFSARVQNTERAIVQKASQQVLSLVSEVAEVLADKDRRLSDSEGRKSCLAKLEAYIQRIPQLNITNDPELNALYAAVKERLDVTTAQIREDEGLRELAAANALNIALKFGNMMNRRIAA
jgi:hypothetical protein